MKKISLAIIIALVLNMSLPVCAAEYNSAGTHSVAVDATVASTYTVALPATLTLTNTSGSNFTGTYTVGVLANLDSHTKITVVPVASFELTNEDNTHTEVATITQAITEWRKVAGENILAANKDASVDTTGTVNVSLPYAGAYEGTFTFTFGSANIE